MPGCSVGSTLIIHGVVRGGKVETEEPLSLPEGTRVEVTLERTAEAGELGQELAAWDRASTHAWQFIEALEGDASA
jgi:hypothetical protein